MMFCPYLFLVSPSFCASGLLRFVIVSFSGYLHLYLCFSFVYVVYYNIAVSSCQFCSPSLLLSVPREGNASWTMAFPG